MDDRKRAFLERLWELQDAAGLNDKELAAEIGVAQSSISRARNHEQTGRTFGVEFAIRACDRFPELRRILHGDFPIGQNVGPMGKGEGAS